MSIRQLTIIIPAKTQKKHRIVRQICKWLKEEERFGGKERTLRLELLYMLADVAEKLKLTNEEVGLDVKTERRDASKEEVER